MKTLMIAALLACTMLLPAAARAQDAAAPKTTTVESTLTALADIELRMSVDRDFDGSAKALDQLVAAAQSAGAATVLEDARVAAAVTRIRAAITSARSVDQSELKQAVLKAMVSNDAVALGAMGSAALDILSDMIHAGETTLVDSHRVSPVEMLRMVFRLDVGRGTDILLDLRSTWNTADGPWPSILADALDEGQWKVVPGRHPEPPEARLLDLVAEVLRGAKTWRDLGSFMSRRGDRMGLLSTLAKFDALSPPMCAELARLAKVSTWNDTANLVYILRGNEQVSAPSARPVFESLLGDERVEARRLAADALAASPNVGRLLDAAGDPDAIVRKSVAQAIRQRSVRQWVFEVRDQLPQAPVEWHVGVPDDPRCLATLETLSRDRDAGVREAAAKSLMDLPDLPNPDVLRALAHDPDPGVRAVLASTGHPSSELVGELLLILASDSEPLVLNKVDQRLNDVDWTRDLQAFLPVLEARVAHPTLPFGRGVGYDLGEMLNAIAQSPEARRELSIWSIETGDPRPLQAVVGAIHPRGEGGYETDSVNIWAALEPNQIARLLPMLQRADFTLVGGFIDATRSSPRRAAIAASLDPLVADETLPTSLRLAVAAYVLGTDPTSERIAAGSRLLGSPAVRDWEPASSWDPGSVRAVVSAVPESARNAMIRGLIGSDVTGGDGQPALELNPDVPAQFARSILAGYAPAAPGGEQLTRLILRRWLDAPGGRIDDVSLAVSSLGSLSDPESATWLRRALRNPAICEVVLTAMSHRPEPEFLNDIGDGISADWIRDESTRAWISSKAINLLVGKFSQEAGEALLARAGTAPSPKLRDDCLEGVTKIRSYLDSMDEWQKRKASSATREAAIGQLVELLHDADPAVRAESVRGLATLHAIEQLPVVIEALHDPEASVRKAAVQALDRLNADVATAEPAPAGG